MSNPEKEQPTTDEPATDEPATDEPATGGSIDHLPGDDAQPLSADEGEPDVEPYGGDDDIASGHVGPDA